MLSRFLNWRAGRVPIGAKDAAIPRLRLQHRTAALAFIVELTGVGRHHLSRLAPAGRARDYRDELHQRPRTNLSSAGSMWPQLAAATTVIEAQSRSASVVRERCGEAQPVPEAQAIGRFTHHAAQPPTIAKALIESSGTRHSAIVSSPPRTPAPAPSAASPSGIAQHEDATTAPSPARSPKAANHFGEAGRSAEDEVAGVVSRAVSLMVMVVLALWSGYPAPCSGYGRKRNNP
jgi:hypothetical protein